LFNLCPASRLREILIAWALAVVLESVLAWAVLSKANVAELVPAQYADHVRASTITLDLRLALWALLAILRHALHVSSVIWSVNLLELRAGHGIVRRESAVLAPCNFAALTDHLRALLLEKPS
jgi:hypothetical protein